MSSICNCRTSKFSVLDLQENKDRVCPQVAPTTPPSATLLAPLTNPSAAGQQLCDVELLILSALATEGVLFITFNYVVVTFPLC